MKQNTKLILRAIKPLLNFPNFLKYAKRQYSTNLYVLEERANTQPNDAYKQEMYLEALNNSNQPQEVIRRYLNEDFAKNEKTKEEYLKALLKISEFSIDSQNVSSIPKAQKYNSKPNFQQEESQNFYQQQQPNQFYQQQQDFQNYQQQQQRQYESVGGHNFQHNSPQNPIFVQSTSVESFFSKVMRVLSITVTVAVVYILYNSYKGVTGQANSKGGGAFGQLLNLEEPKPVFETGKKFSDVKGIEECVEEIQEIADFLKEPEKYQRLGGKLPKGVLLHGPPGTGKTLLAKAIAGEAGVPFFFSSGSEFEEMFVGVGARRIKALFAAARKHSPCIIFIDEIDSIGGKRNARDSQHARQSLNQLLAEMDGFKEHENPIVVIGATNFMDSLDSALLRAGRLDKKIEVPPPTVKGRKEILNLYLQKSKISSDLNVDKISRLTSGFTGADLENLVNLASVNASKKNKTQIDMGDMDYAFDRVVIGLENQSLNSILSEKEKMKTAVHECGHAIIRYLQNEKALHKLTIIPRGKTLGVAYYIPSESSEYIGNREGYLQTIDQALGGMAAEEVFYGKDKTTSGVSSDLQSATQTARLMVTRFGMSDLGAVDFGSNYENLSSEMKHAIDCEIQKIIKKRYEITKEKIVKNKYNIEQVAKNLIEFETLSGQEFSDIIAGKKIRTGLSKSYVKFD